VRRYPVLAVGLTAADVGPRGWAGLSTVARGDSALIVEVMGLRHEAAVVVADRVVLSALVQVLPRQL